MTDKPIAILSGGRERWKAEGRPIEPTPADAISQDDRIDFLFWVHDRHLGNDQAARDYLAWEEQLPAQIEADGDATYLISGLTKSRRCRVEPKDCETRCSRRQTFTNRQGEKPC